MRVWTSRSYCMFHHPWPRNDVGLHQICIRIGETTTRYLEEKFFFCFFSTAGEGYTNSMFLSSHYPKHNIINCPASILLTFITPQGLYILSLICAYGDYFTFPLQYSCAWLFFHTYSWFRWVVIHTPYSYCIKEIALERGVLPFRVIKRCDPKCYGGSQRTQPSKIYMDELCPYVPDNHQGKLQCRAYASRWLGWRRLLSVNRLRVQ